MSGRSNLGLTKRRAFVVIVALSIILVVGISATINPFGHPPASQTSLQSSSGSSNSSSISISASTSSIAPETSSSTTSLVDGTHETTSAFDLRPCNCSVDLRLIWPTYNTLGALANASDSVIIGNVSAVTTESINDGLGVIPVIVYNVTISSILAGNRFGLTAGDGLRLGQVGGNISTASMTVVGYPNLSVGHSYVLFLTIPRGLGYMYGAALITTGGPQGLFYIQDAKVYSIDNLYPQTDSWLPVKTNGVPLPQFIAEVEASSSSSAQSAS